ncbi:MAG: hypothetical protein ABL997_08505 [Planctomycetota bacterium]
MRLLCSLILALLLHAPTTAQHEHPIESQRNGRREPKATEPSFAQPSDFDFGVLPVRASAEAAVLVFWNAGTKSTHPVVIEAPPYVEVTSFHTTADERTGVRTTLAFTLKPSQPGALQGRIQLCLDDRRVDVAIAATAVPQNQLLTPVLIANSPFDAWSTVDSRALQPWREVVAKAQIAVDYVLRPDGQGDLLPVDRLERCEVLLVDADATRQLSQRDRDRLSGFVCGGGRLVVPASAFQIGSVARANVLIEPFGLTMDDREPWAVPGGFLFEGESIAQHPWTEGVHHLRAHRASPTRAVRGQRGLVLAGTTTTDGEMLAFLTVVRTPRGGEVVVLGESMWWTWPGRSECNARMLGTLLTRNTVVELR